MKKIFSCRTRTKISAGYGKISKNFTKTQLNLSRSNGYISDFIFILFNSNCNLIVFDGENFQNQFDAKISQLTEFLKYIPINPFADSCFN